MAAKLLEPVPPGEILYEDFMKPLGVSINALAREIAVPPNRISDIVNGKRSIRQSCSRIRQRMTGFRNGSKRESFSNCGKRESSGLMSYAESAGTGFRWTGPEPSRH